MKSFFVLGAVALSSTSLNKIEPVQSFKLLDNKATGSLRDDIMDILPVPDKYMDVINTVVDSEGGAGNAYSEERVRELEESFNKFVEQANMRAMGTLAFTNGFEFDVAGTEGNEEGNCCKCTMQGASHIIQETYRHFEMMCKDTKCPFIKRKCEMAMKDPQFTIGYMIGMLRPFEKAYFYCFGAKECPHPCPCGPHENENCNTCDMSHIIEQYAMSDYENTGLDMKGQVIVSQQLNQLLEFALDKDSAVYKSSSVGDLNFDSFEEAMLVNTAQHVPCSENECNCQDQDGENCDCQHCGCSKCSKCIHRVGVRVYVGAIKKAAEFCKHTKCPKAKKMCKLAEEHEHIVAGLIWQRMRPMEWSCGFCHGKGVCERK